MGGIAAMAPRGIATYALDKTIELSKTSGLTLPQHALRSAEPIALSGVLLEPFYPGRGHTADNIVVWIPQDKVLDGGCFAKAAASTNLGNTRESDVDTWITGVDRVLERYSSASIVVPGHGPTGGRELLPHTRDLLRAANCPMR